jgi:FkbM family methyltransferase
VFDVGAHVGDRVRTFRRLGARVVAIEPQPALAKVLRLFYGRDPLIKIEAAAVGRQVGTTELSLNMQNPTVSTASAEFIAAARNATGWQDQRWAKRIRVPVTTLDALIAAHGMPSFIKIDVEGFEAEALGGLSRPPAALSFEFTLIQPDIARACITRCIEFGYKRFNAALGESQQFEHANWIEADEMRRWLDGLPMQANSGDIYARFV